MLASFGFARAQKSVTGIIVTYPGAEVSYKLNDVPTVKYLDVDGETYAAIYLKDVNIPVMAIPLHGNTLTITYGEYSIPTSIESIDAGKAQITEREGRKCIQGGKLIIIDKYGKKYSIDGRPL